MINVFGSLVGKEELAEIKDCIDNQWLGIGPKTTLFEKMMSNKIGNSFIALDSGSNALYMAVTALNLPKNSDVIVPALTWVSCANAVILAGHRPVFADVDYNNINVTNETLDKVKTRRTKAAMVVHYGGLPVIAGIDVPVIGDCAHAVDTYILNTHIAKFNDINIFSFDSIKNIACGELGGISSDNEDYSKCFKQLRYCGLIKSGLQASTDKERWWEYELTIPYPKMLPSDLSCAVGIAQLNKLDKLQRRRKDIWGVYQEQLKEINWLITPPEFSDCVRHSYFTYFIKVINGKRDQLARYLLDNGIYTTVRYEPLHLYKQFGQVRKHLPVAELLNEQLLNLPLHPNLSDKDLNFIIDKIKRFDNGR
jgi:aminotransferase